LAPPYGQGTAYSRLPLVICKPTPEFVFICRNILAWFKNDTLVLFAVGVVYPHICFRVGLFSFVAILFRVWDVFKPADHALIPEVPKVTQDGYIVIKPNATTKAMQKVDAGGLLKAWRKSSR
jgi:hypothetical protein